MIEVTLHLKIHIKTNALFQTDSQTTENNKGHLSDVIIRQVYRKLIQVGNSTNWSEKVAPQRSEDLSSFLDQFIGLDLQVVINASVIISLL